MVSFVVHVVPANKGSNRKGRKSVGGRGASQEDRIPSSGQWSSVHCLELANDVKCLPSKMFCPTRNIVGVPRKPRGAGEFRLTGHSGFSAVRAQMRTTTGPAINESSTGECPCHHRGPEPLTQRRRHRPQ